MLVGISLTSNYTSSFLPAWRSAFQQAPTPAFIFALKTHGAACGRPMSTGVRHGEGRSRPPPFCFQRLHGLTRRGAGIRACRYDRLVPLPADRNRVSTAHFTNRGGDPIRPRPRAQLSQPRRVVGAGRLARMNPQSIEGRFRGQRMRVSPCGWHSKLAVAVIGAILQQRLRRCPGAIRPVDLSVNNQFD